MGVNLACGGEMTPEILAKQSFPAERAAKKAPLGSKVVSRMR